MTTAENFRTAVNRAACDVSVAGVPWPAYKLVALIVGGLVALVVGVVTMTAAPAVLSGAAVGTLAWLGLHAYCAARR